MFFTLAYKVHQSALFSMRSFVTTCLSIKKKCLGNIIIIITTKNTFLIVPFFCPPFHLYLWLLFFLFYYCIMQERPPRACLCLCGCVCVCVCFVVTRCLQFLAFHMLTRCEAYLQACETVLYLEWIQPECPWWPDYGKVKLNSYRVDSKHTVQCLYKYLMNSYSVKVAVLEYSKCYTIIESAVTVVNLRHMKMYILQILHRWFNTCTVK